MRAGYLGGVLCRGEEGEQANAIIYMQMRSAINVPAAARQRQQRGRRCVGVATMAGTWAVGGFGQIELKCTNRTAQHSILYSGARERGIGSVWLLARGEGCWFGGGNSKWKLIRALRRWWPHLFDICSGGKAAPFLFFLLRTYSIRVCKCERKEREGKEE